jgi:hypothetical protein
VTEQRPDDDRLSGAMRAALAESVATPFGDCPDTSTLAAYVERTLTATERSVCDTHVSTCARCQIIVAAIVRSDERRAPRSAWAWLQLGMWRWAVPAAAAATALAIWVMVAQPARGPVAGIVEQGRPPVALEPPAPDTAPRPGTHLDASREAEGRLSADAAKAEPGRPLVDEPAEHASPSPPGLDLSTSTVPSATPEAEMAPTRAKARADALPPAAPAPPLAAASPPLPATPQPAPTREQVGAATGPRQDVRQESLQTADRAAYTSLAMAVPVQIATPDPRIRWRVSGSLAQRSTDGGVSWTDQPLEPAAAILAGAAVSTRIAWLAGTGGAVFRTVDGASWTRVSPPSSDDLVAIEAASQERATVTSRSGQRFATADGGRTWTAF